MKAERVREYLQKHEIAFEEMHHAHAVGAQAIAHAEHESGWRVAKPVMLKLGKRLAMAVVPAPARVDVSKVKLGLGLDHVELAAEAEFASAFPDCELGAEPPFGNLYGMPVLVDRALLQDPYLVFRDGTHEGTLKTATADYLRAVDAIQLDMGVLATDVPHDPMLEDRPPVR